MGAIHDTSAGATGAAGAPARQGALLFEVAWEVCAKVGGIYTVLRSKAPTMTQQWGDAYCLIGPYREESARIELEPEPARGPVAEAISELAMRGLRMHFGRWLITGRPQVLLIELGPAGSRLADIKYSLWADNGIGSPAGDFEFDETAIFGWAVAEFLEVLRRRAGQRPVLAHFHEWQAAAAIPMLRHRGVEVGTVFTTHATLVGRNLSAANADLYNHIGGIDSGAVAFNHGFGHRHALEGAAAQACDVFTTVSGITGLEAQHFLGRTPDVLLPNGLNVERFSAPHEFQVLHRTAKEQIHEFVIGHFFPSYTFDLDRTLYFFTAGRYEYRNKGLDVVIDALGELNRRMRAEHSPVTVVTFIITRAPYRAINVDTLNRQAMLTELRDLCDAIKENMGRRLFHSVAKGHLPTIDDLLEEYSAVRLRRMIYAWRARSLPAIVTHDLIDDGHDPVLQHMRHCGLFNGPDDPVKVVFHPEFLSTTSPLLALEYDEFLRGCHLGLFPSYYEPWGYTPLECVVSGIPAITSDLSGFGDYVQQNFPQHAANGIYVARRRDGDFRATVDQTVGWLLALTRMSRRERITLRNRVESLAEHFDWKHLGQHYAEAHTLALERRFAAPAPDLRSPASASTAETGERRHDGPGATSKTTRRRRPGRSAGTRRGSSP